MILAPLLALHLAGALPGAPVARLASMTHAAADAGIEDAGHAEEDAGHVEEDAGHVEEDAGHAEEDAGHHEDAGPQEITDAGPPPVPLDAGGYDGGSSENIIDNEGDMGSDDCSGVTHCVDETDCCEGFQCSGGSCEPLQANPNVCAGQFGCCCGSVGGEGGIVLGALLVLGGGRWRRRRR